ncbi:MAG: hypothetical protein ACJ74Q_25705 [Pyrinomonadaceae bacterium]
MEQVAFLTEVQPFAPLRQILGMLLPFCGFVILMFFYVWLRRKQVYDHSLIWLSVCLLSLIPTAAVQFYDLGEAYRPLALMASSLSNAVSVATAFHLLRVREAIKRWKVLEWTNYFTWAFVGAGALIWVLMGLKLGGQLGVNSVDAAALIDGMASCLSVIMLGLCMSYSFYKYGNQLMIYLTVADFGYILWYQLYMLVNKQSPPGWVFLIAADITSTAFLTMLFIALSLAWGLSSTSRLKFKEHEHVNIVAMFIDHRGSTASLTEAAGKGVGDLYVNFTNKFCEWVMGYVSGAMGDTAPVVKFEGDGLALVWEVSGNLNLIDCANAVVGLACALDGGYSKWRADSPEWKNHVPRYIGVGVDFGDASRFTSESGSYEYLGRPLSYAAKMQGLAQPHGGVVIRDKWELPDFLRCKFTKKGMMIIGNDCIPVRATGRVRFNPPQNGRAGADNLGLD